MAKGHKTGGRTKGTPNKSTVARMEALAETLDGEDPLLFWAGILRNADAGIELRMAAAKELAPYRHPKLSSTEANIKANVTHEGLLDRVAKAENEGTI